MRIEIFRSRIKEIEEKWLQKTIIKQNGDCYHFNGAYNCLTINGSIVVENVEIKELEDRIIFK